MKRSLELVTSAENVTHDARGVQVRAGVWHDVDLGDDKVDPLDVAVPSPLERDNLPPVQYELLPENAAILLPLPE